jgi:hypothetical protein
MPQLGKAVIDGAGVIVRADREFCATMRSDRSRIVGCNMLDFTAPADRERCIYLLDRLLSDGIPVSTVKRLVRADKSHFWVCSRLQMCTPELGEIRIDTRIETAAPPNDWIDPEDLLRVAALMTEGRRARANSFPATLFTDHAWDILLAAYMSEAEGAVLRTADLQGMIGLSLANAARWMRALNAEGLLEYEQGDGPVLATTSFRLSCEAHQKFERYLSDRFRSAATVSPNIASEI